MATLIDKVYSLNIGVQGENIARPIELDMTEWVEAYPDASFYVLFRPYNESEAVPMLSTFEDNILTWTPTLSATAVSGVGYTEVRALDPETGLIRKSRIIPTSVENSVTGADENPPQPYTDWVNRILEAGSDAVKGAAAVAAVSQGEEVAFEIDDDGHLNIVYTESGEPQTLDLGPVDAYAIAVVEGYTGTREEWVQAMADAEANGLKAEGYAIGKQNGVAVESGEYYQNNAKYYNEQAQSAKEDAEAAQTAAETAQTAAETAQTSAEASATEAAQYTSTAVHTWLENNIDPATGYALDRTLTEPLEAAPADMVGDLKSALFMATGNDAIFMSDGYLGLTGSTPIDPTSPTITQNYKHAFIECSPGDLFTVSAAGGATPRAWGFLDSDKIPMEEKETANVRIIDKLIEAPTGAAYFVINNKENGLHSYIGKSMKKTEDARKTTEDARYELVSNAINIRSDRSDFTINKYYRTGPQGIAALNGWMCTHKYAALAGKEYTLVHDLTDPVKSIYAIAYDADDTYLDYKRINYSNSIIIDDLLSTYKKAKYIALDFDVSDQIATLTSEDVASWYLEVSDVSKAVHDNLVDATSKNITVDGNNLATTSLTWGYKFLKPISAFIWKPIFNSNNSKLITCNIYKKDNEHTPYYDGNQRNDYITLSESFKVLKDGFIILRDIEPDTYIEVVSTGDTINYRDPDSTTEKLDNQFLEMGNYKTVDDDRIFNTNESSYNKSFLSGEYFYVLKNPVLSVLKGKKIACIGDSITEHNFRAWVNWVMYLESWTGCKIQNLGQSGRGFVNDYAATSYIDKIALITGTPDMIGVACSFNDVYTGKGQTIDWTTENGRTAGKVYIDDFWDALLTAYPTVPFICFCEGPWYNARPGIAASDGYISTVKKSCNEHGVPFYDGLYYGTALRPWIQANKEVYFVSDNPQELPMGTVDNTHPNSKGHKFIARYLVNKFSENIYSDGLDYR